VDALDDCARIFNATIVGYRQLIRPRSARCRREANEHSVCLRETNDGEACFPPLFSIVTHPSRVHVHVPRNTSLVNTRRLQGMYEQLTNDSRFNRK
jgi:hypothetical protein